MEKLEMHTADLAKENYEKLAALFPNAVTETIDEEGHVVRAIDKDVLMQEINTQMMGRNAISLPGRINGKPSCLQISPLPKH